MEFDSLIYVAGHTGLIGTAVVRVLKRAGYRSLITRTRRELDLEDSRAVHRFFDDCRPQYVVLAAGRVGGIIENNTYPADFMDQNFAIQINVLRAARRFGVRKLIFFGSSCMYPRECSQPMAEEALLTGRPELTSLPYAIAKLAGTYLCLAYNKQDQANRFIPVIPNSTYGPHDNFDIDSGHVLAALIARFHLAKERGHHSVTLWGTGKPRREFVYADDVASACLHLLRLDGSALDLPINIGVENDVSIKELSELVARVVGYRGAIHWDASKPDGAPRKLLNCTRLHAMGWKAETGLAEGLEMTYRWYVDSLAGKTSD